MHALIISTNGEDVVHVTSTLRKAEAKALEIIKGEIDTSQASWENFGQLEVEQLLMESITAGDAECAMDLFADISDARGDMVFMRIVKAEVELDS